MISLVFLTLFLLIIDFFITTTYDLRYFLGYLFEKEYKKFLQKARYVDISNDKVAVIVPIKNEPLVLVQKFVANFLNEKRKRYPLNIRLYIVDDSEPKKKREYLYFFQKISKINFYENGNLEVYHLVGTDIFYIYRKSGIKRKGAAIQDVLDIIEKEDIEFFATYDIEWTINFKYILYATKILKSHPNLAFVSWNRRTVPWSFLHKALNLITDYFFEVLLSGKQMFKEPVMYHGSCTLLRLSYVKKVGGFNPHITEDADLNMRLYLAGYKGLHVREWVEYGQNLPGNFNMALRTYTRWVYGTQNVTLNYLKNLYKSKNLKLTDKLSFVHMFVHFFTFLFVIIFLIIGYLFTFFVQYPPIPTYISFLFYSIPLTSLFIQYIILYIIGIKMYKDYNPLLPVLGLLISWGISVIAINALIKNLVKYKEPWIVTVKIKKTHRIYIDLFVSYLALLILSIVYFIYNLPNIVFTTFSLWISALLLYAVMQIKHLSWI